MNSATVLAVEDDEDNLLLLVHALEPVCGTLLTAIDGSTALELAKTHQPKLILTDIMMPNLDGFELLIQLRQLPETRNIPVVAVTAMASDLDRERIEQAGFQSYLSKPYMLDDLQNLVSQYLLQAQ